MPPAQVEESLRAYNRRRDFRKTPEPRGKAGRSRGRSFVVQKHDASTLHYDFRLEHDGVLLSWAVTKGPSLDPSDKRLAARTEDHPLAYGGFEGVIPEGEYGGGTVMLWDRGTWEPEGDPDEGLKEGKLKFMLHGERMTGGWTLVRMRPRGKEKRENWLLIKERDEAASEHGGELTGDARTSVASGRSMEEIAGKQEMAAPSRTGRSDRDDAEAIEVEGVRVTRPDRVLFPGQGVTKRDLIDHYLSVADAMLAHAADRPLALVRCPDGQRGECFYQKHASRGFPDAFRTVEIKEKSGTGEYLYIDDAAGLVAAVQMGVLELHIRGGPRARLEKPDRLVFDLDPGIEADFSMVKEAAREVRQRLGDLGLESFLLATGGKGLHVVVPLERRHSWEEHKNFAKAMARAMAQDTPERYIATMSKAKRKGKIFVDYLRNDRGNTAIAPFSSRAREGAPVAFPVSWNAFASLKDARSVHVGEAAGRLKRYKSPPWEGYHDVRQRLPLKAVKA